MTSIKKYQEIDASLSIDPVLEPLLDSLLTEVEQHERLVRPRARKRKERDRINLRRSIAIVVANLPDHDTALLVPRGLVPLSDGTPSFRSHMRTWNIALDMLHSLKLIYLHAYKGGSLVARPTRALRERLALAAQSALAS